MQLQLEVRALQRIVILVKVALIVKGIIPLGHAQSGQKDIGTAVALFPAVEHFTVIDLVQIITIDILNGIIVDFHSHCSMLVAVPGSVPEMGVDDDAVGTDIVFHQHVHIILVYTTDHIAVGICYTLVHNGQELAGTTCI